MEAIKSDLRAKETEIAAMRDGALSGLANRQALLSQRRLEAIERVWAEVVDLAPAKSMVIMLANFDLEKAEQLVEQGSKLREMFGTLSKDIDLLRLSAGAVAKERLFLTPIVWAPLSAYQSIALLGLAQVKMFGGGYCRGARNCTTWKV